MEKQSLLIQNSTQIFLLENLSRLINNYSAAINPHKWHVYLCTSYVYNGLNLHNIFYIFLILEWHFNLHDVPFLSFFLCACTGGGAGGQKIYPTIIKSLPSRTESLKLKQICFANENDRISQLKKALPIREYKWTPR